LARVINLITRARCSAMCLNNSVIIPQCQKNKNCHTAAHELDKFMCNRVAALTMHARTHARYETSSRRAL